MTMKGKVTCESDQGCKGRDGNAGTSIVYRMARQLQPPWTVKASEGSGMALIIGLLI